MPGASTTPPRHVGRGTRGRNRLDTRSKGTVFARHGSAVIGPTHKCQRQQPRGCGTRCLTIRQARSGGHRATEAPTPLSRPIARHGSTAEGPGLRRSPAGSTAAPGAAFAAGGCAPAAARTRRHSSPPHFPSLPQPAYVAQAGTHHDRRPRGAEQPPALRCLDGRGDARAGAARASITSRATACRGPSLLPHLPHRPAGCEHAVASARPLSARDDGGAAAPVPRPEGGPGGRAHQRGAGVRRRAGHARHSLRRPHSLLRSLRAARLPLPARGGPDPPRSATACRASTAESSSPQVVSLEAFRRKPREG